MLAVLTEILLVLGINLAVRKNENGVPLLIWAIVPFLFLISLLFGHSTEKQDLEYIRKARLHAEYIGSGAVHDLDEYADIYSQVVKANNKILETRKRKDSIWIGYAYFESVANQELITLDIKKNE